MIRCYSTFKQMADPAFMDASVFLSRMLIYDQDVMEALVQAVHCCRKYRSTRRLMKQYDARGYLCLRLYDGTGVTNAPAVDTLMHWFDQGAEEAVFDYLTQQSGIAYQARRACNEF